MDVFCSEEVSARVCCAVLGRRRFVCGSGGTCGWGSINVLGPHEAGGARGRGAVVRAWWRPRGSGARALAWGGVTRTFLVTRVEKAPASATADARRCLLVLRPAAYGFMGVFFTAIYVRIWPHEILLDGNSECSNEAHSILPSYHGCL